MIIQLIQLICSSIFFSISGPQPPGGTEEDKKKKKKKSRGVGWGWVGGGVGAEECNKFAYYNDFEKSE